MTFIPRGSIDQWLPRLDSAVFSPEVYAAAGVFVLRNAIRSETIAAWQNDWRTFYETTLAAGRKVDPFNAVVVHEEVPESLANVHRDPDILDVMERVYPDLALYMQRLVVKDRSSRTPVFLHHDFGYDLGWPEKTAVFVPLTEANAENGGVTFYPGTHALGYMGDVGEIDPSILDPEWPALCPSLHPGDLALMHECTWHSSPAAVNDVDRVLVQITYQPASDPSSVALLRGSWRTDVRLSEVPRESLFKRSRSSRLRELQAEVNRLKGETR